MNNLISKHPSPNRKLAARVAACGVTVALAAGCGGGGGKSSPKPQVTVSGGASSPGTLPTSAAGDTTGTPALAGGVTPKYPLLPTPIPAYTGKDLAKWTDPMKAASDRGLKVWIETDLVGAWLTGPDAFTKAVSKVGAEAQTPGVVGFKIADELGQPGQKTTTSPQQAMLFLHDARAALNSVAPGKLILVDIIGFDLGCVPGSSSSWQKKCVESNGAADASMSLDTIGQIVDSGYIDELNVTTYMQDAAKYQKTFGVSLADAQRAAFAEIKNRHWDTKVVVNTRKAFSFPTDKIADANAAAALVGDFIDVPITAGAKAVDTWAFSQKYAKSPSGTVSQMSPGSQSNALWEAFKAEKAKNVNLFTHYTPSTPMGTVQQDMDNIAQAFTGVFCAAGTG
jgi:hypothetical protein